MLSGEIAHQIVGHHGVFVFTIPTINFRVLYCFIVLLHGRRKIVHFNVTTNPTAHWAAQQIIEAFPDVTAHLKT